MKQTHDGTYVILFLLATLVYVVTGVLWMYVTVIVLLALIRFVLGILGE